MEKTLFIVDKGIFKKQIKEQIELGNSLLNKTIRTKKQFNPYTGYSEEVYLYHDKNVFLNEVQEWKSYVCELLKQSFNDADNEYLHEFKNTGIHLYVTNNTDKVESAKDELEKKVSWLNSFCKRSDLIPEEKLHNNIVKVNTNVDSRNVFIVHGHDEHLRTEVELLIKQLDYNPIVLFKEPNQGQTIIEKIENQADNAVFGIVLYTGCDLGADKNDAKNLNLRARQNVVFEHGYLCAKLGRNKVCAICDKDIEIPGDLSGIVYIPHAEGWQYIVAKEMKAAGLEIDLNKIKF